MLPSVISTKQTIFINQTLYIDVYNDGDTLIRTAEIRNPVGSMPSKFSLSDACNSPSDNTFPIQYFMDAEVTCDMNISQWDIGGNITKILNDTTTLIKYQKKQIDDCKNAIKENIEMHKELEICTNKTEYLNKYSSLQSAYDVCDDNRRSCQKELKTCEEKYEKANGEKINYFIFGLIAAGILLAVTRPKLFKSPTEKQFMR